MAKPPAPRTFTAEDAVPSASSLLIGLSGASGGGKTFSALRLATGIQRVFGGEIYYVDTDNRRALHYARQFKFKHVPFEPPFTSAAYVQAIEFCERQGAGVIIVDSMSHEHEGSGGMLEYHEAEVDRLAGAGADWRRRESVKMLAWTEPKKARKKLILKLQRLQTPTLLCFRAKESAKPVRVKQDDGSTKTEVIAQGFRPIAGDELVFEMTLNALLYPNSGGVATWETPIAGEAQMIKLPEQFKSLRDRTAPLDENLGEDFAKWAKGPTGAKAAPGPQDAPQGEKPAKGDKGPSAPETPATGSPAPAGGPSEDDFPGDRPSAPPGNSDADREARLREQGFSLEGTTPEDDGAPPAPQEDEAPAGVGAETSAGQGQSLAPQGVAGGVEDNSGQGVDGFSAFVEVLIEAKGWADIEPGLRVLTKSAAWIAADDGQRAAARAGAYRAWRQLRDSGADKGIDADIEPHLMRCYLEFETDPDTLAGMWQVAQRQPKFQALPTPSFAAFEKAVVDRVAHLKASPVDAGEFE